MLLDKIPVQNRMRLHQKFHFSAQSSSVMSKRKSNSVGGLSTGIDNRRLDVVVTQEGGDSIVTLQLSTWSDLGGGWQVEKTIPIAARQLSQLQRLLAQARYAIADHQTGAEQPGQVIPIGTHRTAAPSLPAAPAKRKNRKAAN